MSIPLSRTKVELDVSGESCPVTAVTVFGDRAEVIRQLIIPKEYFLHGKTELLVEISGLTIKSDADTIRIRGTGPVLIQEVAHDIKHAASTTISNTNSARINELREKEEALKQELLILNQKLGIITQQRQFLSSYVQGSLAPTATDTSKVFGAVPITLAKDLLEFYSNSSESLNSEENKLKNQQKGLNKQLTLIQSEIAQITNEPYTVKKQRVVNLYLEVLENHGEEAMLYLSYLVMYASWTPSYDIRVESTTKELTLYYYGEVKQNTDEDWVDCELTLSTAKPSVGGSPPPLPKKTANFFVYRAPQPVSDLL